MPFSPSSKWRPVSETKTSSSVACRVVRCARLAPRACCRFSSAGKATCGCSTARLQVAALRRTERILAELPGPGAVTGRELSPDGTRLAIVGDKGVRIVYEEAGPVEVSSSWMPEALAKRAPRLLKRQRIREGTIAYIERTTGRRARLGRDRITARLASAEEATALQLGDGPAAVLVIHHTAFDAVGDPIEFAEAVFTPGRWSFQEEYPISG